MQTDESLVKDLQNQLSESKKNLNVTNQKLNQELQREKSLEIRAVDQQNAVKKLQTEKHGLEFNLHQNNKTIKNMESASEKTNKELSQKDAKIKELEKALVDKRIELDKEVERETKRVAELEQLIKEEKHSKTLLEG